eukprot:symbB.v1.2.001905.t3/scaffold102.1/size330044/2
MPVAEAPTASQVPAVSPSAPVKVVGWSQKNSDTLVQHEEVNICCLPDLRKQRQCCTARSTRGYQTGVHRFGVKVLAGEKNCAIGLVSSEWSSVASNPSLGRGVHSWALESDGTTWANGRELEMLPISLAEGSLVIFDLDLGVNRNALRSATLQLNGQSFQHVFTDLPETVYPAASNVAGAPCRLQLLCDAELLADAEAEASRQPDEAPMDEAGYVEHFRADSCWRDAWSNAIESIEAAMAHELTVNILNGDAFTLDVTSIETVQQLKWMLCEKFCDDPIEQKILKVDILKDSDLLEDAQTLNESGLHAEPEVTVIYRRNEVEAATQEEIHTEEFCQVNIPQTVTRVDDRAFQSCHPLVKVTIPDSVTEIGDAAFEGCASLESVTIPDSVTEIGHGAFAHCTSLESVTIPDLVTWIGSGAFEDCTSLKSITIPDWVTSIANGCFRHCTSLESVTIPHWVTSIANSAFRHCTSLESVTIANWVTSIGDRAFRDCTSLERVTIPDSVSLEIALLWKASPFPTSVTEIGSGAFEGCSSLKSITIPDWVTCIENGAFRGCDSLESITIPDWVTEIGEWAFAVCSSLKSITIPDSVTEIGEAAFAGCTSLKSLTIPDSVTEIGEWAFADCTSLESITIPDWVTCIENGAFRGCDSLESITIPDSVTEIGDDAFEGCTSLKRITIPDWVTEIGEGAFADCTSLESITIPDCVTVIGAGAFDGSSCLKSITIPQLVTEIPDGAFRDCTSLESITIPSSVQSIWDGAFEGCSSLKSITIPDWVTCIENGAFRGCASLQSITISDSVTKIGSHAFADCTSLESITIPDCVTVIGAGAFDGSSCLKSITIPHLVTEIPDGAFRDCTSLESITIPDSGRLVIFDLDLGVNRNALRSATLQLNGQSFQHVFTDLPETVYPSASNAAGAPCRLQLLCDAELLAEAEAWWTLKLAYGVDGGFDTLDEGNPPMIWNDEAGYMEHFREHGFVVVADVLEPEQVRASIAEIWSSCSLLGAYGFDPQDVQSWDPWPGGCRNFLDSLDPIKEVETWRNRVNSRVNRVFDVLWEDRFESFEDAHEESLVMSVDRIGLMRPTHLKDGEKLIERPEWRTSRNWLHWDQNPWSTPDFEAMQGLLSLAGSASSGGFVTVDGFQKDFAAWAKNHPEGSIPKRSKEMIPFPVPLEDEMQGRRSKIVVPSGALLVWDSRMPHENFPNDGEDWRMVQYVTCKRLKALELDARAAAWQSGFRTGLIPASFASRFSSLEQRRLGMWSSTPDALREALAQAEELSTEQLEAAGQLRRAYRLKQTAELPEELKEAIQLFRGAFAVNPSLQQVLQHVATAERTYLPFWIL